MGKLMQETTYTNARENFAALWDRAVEDREVIVINRKGSENIAIIAESELASLLETAHLLRSPKNAQRLLAAIAGARKGTGKAATVEEMMEAVGLKDK